MWGAAIIVFREVFEIAIILCVILAATKNLAYRGKWILLGILGGIGGAGVIALITQTIAVMSGPTGKQYFNAAILLTAVAMIGWTVIWMKQHSKQILTSVNQVSKAVAAKSKPLYMLATIIGLAVMREGSEVVIFLYGLLAAGQTTWFMVLIGSVIGLSLGIGFGLLMYYGLLRISVKYLFQVTSFLLTFIAGGMAANAAGKLVTAGLLPAVINSLWNTSAWLPQHSLFGRFLFILFGYQENPNAMQALFYVLTMATIFIVAKRKTNTALHVKSI